MEFIEIQGGKSGRYVVHMLAVLPTTVTGSIKHRLAMADEMMKRLKGDGINIKKYRAKWYGGGFVVDTYNSDITKIKEKIQDFKDDLDTFNPTGYDTIYGCNSGGYAVEISKCGGGARVRLSLSENVYLPTEWAQIKYNRKGEAYFYADGERFQLSQIMRVH